MTSPRPGFTAELALSSTHAYRAVRNYNDRTATIRPALPCVYGNWYGPGCGGGNPINDVDDLFKVLIFQNMTLFL